MIICYQRRFFMLPVYKENKMDLSIFLHDIERNAVFVQNIFSRYLAVRRGSILCSLMGRRVE